MRVHYMVMIRQTVKFVSGLHAQDRGGRQLRTRWFQNEFEIDGKIEYAKQVLRNAGYFVDNLWHNDDVKSRYLCDDDEAQHVLDRSLTNEATMNQIWFSIDMVAEDNELTKKEEE